MMAIVRNKSIVIMFNFKQIVLDLCLIILCDMHIEVKYAK